MTISHHTNKPMTYELQPNMNREVSPTAITVTLLLLIACLGFLLWKIVLAPLDNPEPPEIQPGPSGTMAAPPSRGLPTPGH
jgi:hypothetical protein